VAVVAVVASTTSNSAAVALLHVLSDAMTLVSLGGMASRRRRPWERRPDNCG
jgi:hypothetical protein